MPAGATVKQQLAPTRTRGLGPGGLKGQVQALLPGFWYKPEVGETLGRVQKARGGGVIRTPPPPYLDPEMADAQVPYI